MCYLCRYKVLRPCESLTASTISFVHVHSTSWRHPATSACDLGIRTLLFQQWKYVASAAMTELRPRLDCEYDHLVCRRSARPVDPLATAISDCLWFLCRRSAYPSRATCCQCRYVDATATCDLTVSTIISSVGDRHVQLTPWQQLSVIVCGFCAGGPLIRRGPHVASAAMSMRRPRVT
jgi:hypothetical protein